MSTPQLHPTQKPGSPQPELPSVEERWSLLQRIASSEQFSRSARLRDFLLYVGKQSLKPNASEVHEQEIGSRVFGRPVDYDRSQDNIVRVNATELRRRISTYFDTVGTHEPLLVEIPRGGYTPVFYYRTAPGEAPSAAALPPATPAAALPLSESPATAQPLRWLWPAACLVLAVVAGALYLKNRTLEKELEPWSNKPAVAMFWKQYLNTGLGTDIVMPDDTLAMYQDMTSSSVGLSNYVDRSYVRNIQYLPVSDDRKADINEILNHNLVTFGAIRAAQQILTQIPAGVPHSMVLTKLYNADEIKRNNVVLVGGQKSNPWNQLFDPQLNFVVDYDYASKRIGFIRNRHPKNGEQATYVANEVSGGTDSFATYSVVAFLPNLSRNGHVLILAGLDSDATGAAAEFLGSEESMARLRSAMNADKGYPYFEALLRVSRLSGTSLRAEVVAYRTYSTLN